jgi:hypothetical protein
VSPMSTHKSLALIGSDSARLPGCWGWSGRVTSDKEDLKEAGGGACRAMEVQAGWDGFGSGTKARETPEVGPGLDWVEVARSLGGVRCRRMSRLMRRFSAVGHTSAPACVGTLRSQLCIGLRSIEVTAPRLELERSEIRSHAHRGTAERTAPAAHLGGHGCARCS